MMKVKLLVPNIVVDGQAQEEGAEVSVPAREGARLVRKGLAELVSGPEETTDGGDGDGDGGDDGKAGAPAGRRRKATAGPEETR